MKKMTDEIEALVAKGKTFFATNWAIKSIHQSNQTH